VVTPTRKGAPSESTVNSQPIEIGNGIHINVAATTSDLVLVGSLNTGQAVDVDGTLSRIDVTVRPKVQTGSGLMESAADVTLRMNLLRIPTVSVSTGSTDSGASTQPAPYTLRSLIALVPVSIYPAAGSQWTAAKLQAAQDAMAVAIDKPARMMVSVGAVRASGNAWAVTATAKTDNGASANVTLNISDTKLAALLNTGQTVLAEGTISKIIVSGSPAQLAIILQVSGIPDFGPVPVKQAPAPPSRANTPSRMPAPSRQPSPPVLSPFQIQTREFHN
jgi:hypothetical protein